MICVTIGRGRHSTLHQEWVAAAKEGAELVELRLDCLRREPDLKRILTERPTPMVVTLRRAADGGLWRGDEEKRQRLLREAIALGVDYVDLEMDIATKIRKFGRTKRIISYHNVKKTPEELDDLADQCDEMDADVVKVATLASSLTDAMHVLQVAERAQIPTVAIAMGEVGFFTRILGAKFKAPFTYANFNPDRIFAPGMPSFAVLRRDYHYDQINDQTELYAVIGDPIEQSLSPAVHNASFRHLGLNKALVPIHIPANRLQGSLEDLEWIGIKGYSVTVPHKEAIVPLLDRKDEAVERTGSCNTMVVEEGQRVGYNTDLRAAMDSLEDALGGRSETEEGSPLLDKQALILGAGGVARSIAFGLSRRGAVVTLTSRDDEKTTRLAQEIGCRTINWGQRASTLANLMVNCTPVGMHPNVDDTPAAPAAFKPGMFAFDTVYHPENTMFLKLARERGCTTINGVDMFVHQAAHQFRLYTGHDAPTKLMRDTLKAKLSVVRDPMNPRDNPQSLLLVGYRGTGKSTVGRILAERLGRPFADADVELEAITGRTIPAIFAELGEPAFRDREEEILRDLTARPGTIVATGGGVVLRERSRALLKASGFVAWLAADPEVLADRLRADPRGLAHRPSLTGAGTLEEIARVLEVRTPLYREVADAVVDTSRRTPAEAADAILDLWPRP